jgi:hypothetical protein
MDRQPISLNAAKLLAGVLGLVCCVAIAGMLGWLAWVCCHGR